MTKEQIEKAAMGYVMPNARISPLMESIAAQEGFIAGAQWRINAVWHDSSEEPERNGEPMLVEFHDFGMDGNSYDVVEDLQGYRTGIYVEFIRWAYVSDLLPEWIRRKRNEKEN